jgi:hypothetical protein
MAHRRNSIALYPVPSRCLAARPCGGFTIM